MQKKYPYSPVLGWSVSRYDKFESCKRQYWYDYYPKHDREVAPQKLAFLKTLTTTPLEIGNLVHDAIATQLHRIKKGSPPQSEEEILKYSSFLVDRAIQGKTFLEVHYGQKARIDPDDLKQRVEHCLQNFFRSRWYTWLTEEAPQHRRSDWIIEPNDFGEVHLEGLKAYCKVDFLFPTADGDLHILDWKTGRPDFQKHRRQMTGYVAYARGVTQAEISKVRPVIVYLNEGYQELAQHFIPEDIDQFVGIIRKETREMHAYCANVEENIPQPKEFFPPNNRKLCAYCNYQELCRA